MAKMKKIYKAKLKSGLGFCKVYARDEQDARKEAFLTYLFNSAMHYLNPKIDDVVESAELDSDQIMDSVMAYPSSQIDRPVPSEFNAGK